MSYVRVDDKHESGRLSELCSRLSGEVQMQLGQEFKIFQDKNDIAWGQQWKARIDNVIDATTFLIPIITPSFFKSPPCREEIERFLGREKHLGRCDLILPIYYVTCPILNSEQARTQDVVAQTVAARQYADWRELRFEPFTASSVSRTLAGLAGQIVLALEDIKPSRLSLSNIKTDVSGRSANLEDNSNERELADVERMVRPTGRKDPPTLTVDPFHRGDHTNLTDALSAAQPGHRILVRPGLYREAIIIDKPVEIIGDGEPGEVVIEASDKDAILFRANMGRVFNLTIRQLEGARCYGVDIVQGRLDLEACDITSASLACVAIHGGADPRLRRNRIHGGKMSGVTIFGNALGTLEDNEIFGNALAGVQIRSGSNPTLRRNRIYDGKSGGIYILDNGIGFLEDNDIFGNKFANIQVDKGSSPIIRRNRIYGGRQGGLFICDGGLGSFDDNEIFENGYAGVEVKSGANPTLRRNHIHNSRESGIYVHDNGLGTFEDNKITDNITAGITVKSGGNPTVRRNVISRNGYKAVSIYESGGGSFEDNDLRDNVKGAFDVKADCRDAVKRQRNQE